MYKILSLDGGGMHGYASLVILKKLIEKKPDLLDKIDLIAGTSIGGILGLGLALGHNINDVTENFVKGIPLAFNTNFCRLATFVAGVCPKYDNSKFKAFLRGVYGPKQLKDCKKIVIPAFSLDNEDAEHRRWQAKIFHNFEGVDSDGNMMITDVAMATSAAPVFFPSYGKYVDGALVANNPTLCAVTQTQDSRVEISNRPTLDQIAVLSIGTIRDVYVLDRNVNWGYFMWARSLLNMLTERDTLVINHMANILLGDKYHRIEPVINGPMDNFEELKTIACIANDIPLDKTVSWLDEYWN